MMLDEEVSVTYYAVFDGHGGAECAQFLRDNLHIELKKRLMDQIDGIKDSEDINESLANCIERAFEEADYKYKTLHSSVANQCGATAVVVLIIGNKLVCANVGDARAVLCRNGKAIDLSVDHKASRSDEQERIKKQGGYIVFGRVLGRLAVTRAFGDFDCKNIEVPTDENEKEIKNFVLVQPEVSSALIKYLGIRYE
jgi:serine/threonine protein phosphatase PrpC